MEIFALWLFSVRDDQRKHLLAAHRVIYDSMDQAMQQVQADSGPDSHLDLPNPDTSIDLNTYTDPTSTDPNMSSTDPTSTDPNTSNTSTDPDISTDTSTDPNTTWK